MLLQMLTSGCAHTLNESLLAAEYSRLLHNFTLSMHSTIHGKSC